MTIQDDYKTIHESAAIGAISPRLQVAVAGKDRASYLQGLLTNDIAALAPGSGCYAAWLSPQGRMLTDMHVLESGSMILLDLPAETAAATLARLDQFLFSEDVQLGSLAETMTGVWVHGPAAAAALERLLDEAPDIGAWTDYRHLQVAFQGEPVSVARIDQVGVPGYCIHVERSREPLILAALQSAGARVVAHEALEAARVEAGYPVFGVDMTEATIPLEAGIEQRAISFTKGCYVGQEIVIRVLHRGGGRVAKKLVAMRTQSPPAGGHYGRGAKVFSGDREIGEVTSAADSPRLGAIALGYVHRDFTTAGTAIQVAAGSERVGGIVTGRPIAAAGYELPVTS
jgi:tRNA-modifying protein YgfZ